MADGGDSQVVELIARSGAFDFDYFKSWSGADGSAAELVEIYLACHSTGARSPNRELDKAFYRCVYRDALAGGLDPFVHYALKGREEMRYPNMRAAIADAEVLATANLIDNKDYLAALGRALYFDSLELDFLIHGLREDPAAALRIDLTFIRDYYGRIAAEDRNPVIFYARNKGRPWLAGRASDLDRARGIVASSRLFDDAWYRGHYALPSGLDGALHYCAEGYALGYDPSPCFSTSGYFERYRDIRAAEHNPLFHFEQNGRKEGRSGEIFPDSAIKKGGRDFDPSLPTILLVTHEASLTGAPILALAVARSLSIANNVVIWSGKPGVLSDAFSAIACATIEAFAPDGETASLLRLLDASFKLTYAVVNSAVSHALVQPLRSAGIATVALVHEYADYLRPVGLMSKIAVLSSACVFPSDTVKASALAELEALQVSATGANLFVRHQGQCAAGFQAGPHTRAAADIHQMLDIDAPDDWHVVLGCGWVQPRKGVDLFIEAARLLRQRRPDAKVKFLWVGGNYQPDVDMATSVYLRDQIVQSKLDGVVHIIGEQGDLKAFWQVADVFFLSSRLDPFPNVAIDAVMAGVPVVSFRGATGFSEAAVAGSEAITVVDYNDVAAAADAISSLCARSPAVKGALAAEADMWKETFSHERYVDFIADVAEAAIVKQRDIETRIETGRHPPFDARCYQSGLPAWLRSNPSFPLSSPGELLRLFLTSEANGCQLARPTYTYRNREETAGAAHYAATPAGAPDEGPAGAAPIATKSPAPIMHIHVASRFERDALAAIARRRAPFRYVVTMGFDAPAAELERICAARPDLTLIDSRRFVRAGDGFIHVASALRTSAPFLGHVSLAQIQSWAGTADRAASACIRRFFNYDVARSFMSLAARDDRCGVLYPSAARIFGNGPATGGDPGSPARAEERTGAPPILFVARSEPVLAAALDHCAAMRRVGTCPSEREAAQQIWNALHHACQSSDYRQIVFSGAM